MIGTKRLLVVLLAGAALAACGGGNDSNDAPPPPVVVPPPPPPALEDGFGAGFGTRFRADLNGEATDPVPGDLVPLNVTSEATTI